MLSNHHKTILYYFAIIILLMVGIIISLSSKNLPGNIRSFTVQTGSMHPAIPSGSFIITRPSLDYRLGDIITFNRQPQGFLSQNTTITHRIIKIQVRAGQAHIITKGDANLVVDNQPVPFDSIIGRVIFSMPIVGKIFDFLKTKPGQILIVAPGMLIIYVELKKIYQLLRQRQS